MGREREPSQPAQQASTPAATFSQLAQLDAAYQPFPSFGEWQATVRVDAARWEAGAALIESREGLTDAVLREARHVVRRAAAVETGAIEDLYDLPRGYTFSVALQVAELEALLSGESQRVQNLIHSQMEAYERILDLATGNVVIAEAWIRSLHAELCAPQGTYHVLTPSGWQEQALPLGTYKTQSNHVIQPDGRQHAYAPADLVSEEMWRFCQELRSEAFTTAHSVLQAAYAHYAFVAVHPFADGNGRVPRRNPCPEHPSRRLLGTGAARSGTVQGQRVLNGSGDGRHLAASARRRRGCSP